MYCTYKIYYNQSHVLLTCDRAQINKNFTKVFEGTAQAGEFLSNTDFMFDGHTNMAVLVVCEKPGEVICGLMEKLDVVVAGGGIVKNEHDELLLIYRRGYWDLPKGKIELCESIKDGAIREVNEETGVEIESIEEKPIITYHAYKIKGKNCLKETNWFKMNAKPGQKHLVPQTEEDIEEVKWVRKSDLENYKAGSYPLIWDLLMRYLTESLPGTG
ncbi:MAG TPA: NUDIX domain-containing protein [Chitinophagales bacterium]|nr:NUDIX domain-containing protein [Chitinophagales bacterium]